MLKIRLQRVGKVHEPVYRLVLTDSKNGPKSGKFLEILGNFDARRPENTQIKEGRVKYWIGTGVQLSDTVHNMFVDKKIIEGKKINSLPKKTAPKKEEVKEEAPTVEAEPVKEEAPIEEVVAEVPVETPTE